MICLKIRTFVVSATTSRVLIVSTGRLWFAWKFVPLWYQQQPTNYNIRLRFWLWFAWKFVPLWYQQQLYTSIEKRIKCCDLLENSYLCGISNNYLSVFYHLGHVVICLKIRTFVVSATTQRWELLSGNSVVICLKIRTFVVSATTIFQSFVILSIVVICLKIRTFVVSATTLTPAFNSESNVVICLKIRTFVVSATTIHAVLCIARQLWFAWKFVPLWYQQQPH